MLWLTLKKNCTLLRCFYCQLWTDFKFWTNFTYCSSLFIANLEQISLTVAVFYYWLWTKFAHCPNLNFLSLLLILKKHFNNNFLFYSIVKWNKLDENLRNSKSFLIFRNSLLKIGRPIQNSIYKIYNPLGVQFITWLRLGLSQFYKHKFRHHFQDCQKSLMLL